MITEERGKPTAEFVFQHFFRKFGLRKVAEMHVVDLISSIRKYYKNDIEVKENNTFTMANFITYKYGYAKINLFARFCGIHKQVSDDAFDYFIILLAALREVPDDLISTKVCNMKLISFNSFE